MSALVGLLACAAGWTLGAKPWLKPRPQRTIAAQSASVKLQATPTDAATASNGAASALAPNQGAVVTAASQPASRAKLKSHGLQRTKVAKKHARQFASSTYKRH